MSKISATVVADSINEAGDRLTSFVVTMPRYILAEFNTHRMLSRNSASSRAIKFEKMLKSIEENPFIPMAWQKDHTGMQGFQYYTDENDIKRCETAWLRMRDAVVEQAKFLGNKGECTEFGVTKGLVNRPLEAFMYHTVLVSATEWMNFIELRCPVYQHFSWGTTSPQYFRSKKDWREHDKQFEIKSQEVLDLFKKDADGNLSVDWLGINVGMADIHMMATTEVMWDAMNESTPKKLHGGEWHIPFEDKIDTDAIADWIAWDLKQNQYITLNKYNILTNRAGNSWPEAVKIMVATAMAARVSYTTVGDETEITIAKYMEIHEKLVSGNPLHASPMEHCAFAMYRDQYDGYIKRELIQGVNTTELRWCGNFRGFIQYRKLLPNENILTKR